MAQYLRASKVCCLPKPKQLCSAHGCVPCRRCADYLLNEMPSGIQSSGLVAADSSHLTEGRCLLGALPATATCEKEPPAIEDTVSSVALFATILHRPFVGTNVKARTFRRMSMHRSKVLAVLPHHPCTVLHQDCVSSTVNLLRDV